MLASDASRCSVRSSSVTCSCAVPDAAGAATRLSAPRTSRWSGCRGRAASSRGFSICVDGFLEFPGWPGLPEIAVDVRRVPRFLHRAAGPRGFDLALQLHGSGGIVNEIVALLRRAGNGRLSASPDGVGANCELFAAWPGQGNEIERCLQLTDHLRMARAGTRARISDS